MGFWGKTSLLVVLLWSLNATGATVDGIRLWRAPDHTRLVFDLSGPVEHRLFSLANPDRLVIDIQNSQLSHPMPSLELANTAISSVRSGSHENNSLRIVLDLKAPLKPRSFSLASNEQYGDRLVVDLFDKNVQTAKTVDNITTDHQRDIVIAIDAGHGGEDPGAIGPKRIHEKKVVLAISKKLAGLINAQPGFKATLVRSGDYYIPLRKRTDIARKRRADMFISIHADAFSKSSANGASVFALSRRGATSETARYLAQRENRADLIGGVGSVSLDDKDKMLASVLLDLSMTATLSSSLEAGNEVLKEIGDITRLHKKQVEQAGFVVLKSPDIPSILVETGFISNPGEAKKLSNSKYQQKMARAIYNGMKRYFYANPPAGTRLAALSSGAGRVYTITRGDTLSEIASRYNVSTQQLLRHNGLKNANIRIGQQLKIPAS